MLEAQILLSQLHWLLLQKPVCLFKLHTLVQKALNGLLWIERHKRVLEPIDEVEDAGYVIKVMIATHWVAEVATIVHHEYRWHIINRHAFVFEKSELLTRVSSAYFYFFAFFRSVDFLVKLVFELGQNRLCLTAVLARRVTNAKHMKLAIVFLPLRIVFVRQLDMTGLQVR